MHNFGTRVEEVSGLLSFWVGLLCLFVAGEMAVYTHGVAQTILDAVMAVWSIALLVSSRRAGHRVVLFRIVSIVVIVIGTIAAAVFLQPHSTRKRQNTQVLRFAQDDKMIASS
jgi:hypothetical protein